MRISELSQRAGMPVATIKYYLREGLLPAGTRTAPRQATYGELHLRRLRLIRTLREVGELEIERVRRVIDAVDATDLSRHDLYGVAAAALESNAADDDPPDEVLAARSRSTRSSASAAGLSGRMRRRDGRWPMRSSPFADSAASMGRRSSVHTRTSPTGWPAGKSGRSRRRRRRATRSSGWSSGRSSSRRSSTPSDAWRTSTTAVDRSGRTGAQVGVPWVSPWARRRS